MASDIQVLLGYRSLAVVIAAASVALCSVALHPFGAVKRTGRTLAPRTLEVSPQVAALLQRSCMDCHSNNTKWPWYSYVAPVSWLVERDVGKGRHHMNFSAWDDYTPERRAKLLADMASAIENREMPLPQYTIVHRSARMSDADQNLFYQWVRGERRKIKAKGAQTRTGTGR